MSAADAFQPRRLNVLRAAAAPTADDLLRLFFQTGQRRAAELAEAETLEIGVVYANAEFADLPEANLVWDACLPEGSSPSQALAMADAHYASQGSRCGGWALNPGVAAREAAPLTEYLLRNGYRSAPGVVMRLAAAPVETITPPVETITPSAATATPPRIRVIPARASFRHARSLAQGMGLSAVAVEAELRRLDDPHWDRLLALLDGNVIGGVGVLAVGEIGRIDDLQVLPAHRRRGVGAMLLHRAIEICRRSQFRHVLAGPQIEQIAGIALLRAGGFTEMGAAVQYVRSG